MSDGKTVSSRSLSLEDFKIRPVSGEIRPTVLPPASAAARPVDPLGLLAVLRDSRWKGSGFNQIWRPFDGLPQQDRFLELNETSEVLQFVEIPGDIPNRGLLQADIMLHGLTYLQKISDVNVLQDGKPTGIHIEPGIWVAIPNTANPQDPQTVARLANIPHGTSLVSQGTATFENNLSLFPETSIAPFPIGQAQNPIQFPESNLDTRTQFRTPRTDIPHVTQEMVDNPNILLASMLPSKIVSVTVLRVSTSNLNPPPSSGGGTSNIAFLQGAAAGPNAQAAQMDATFWIEEFHDNEGNTKFQLQYSQRVLLNFNRLSWPHVSVATLIKE